MQFNIAINKDIFKIGWTNQRAFSPIIIENQTFENKT